MAFVLLFISSEAQTITEKNISSGAAASYGESNFKRAPKRVYIAEFRTNFHVTATSSASTMDAKTSLTVAVSGVDSPDFQKLTDDAYNNFVGDLKANGYEIISAEEAAKTEYYADWILKEGGSLSTAQLKGYVSATPTGYKYLIKSQTAKGKEKSTFVDTSNKLSRELDAATIINVEYNFPLFEMDASKSGVYSFTSVTAKIKYQVAPTVRFVSSEKMGKDAIMNYTAKGGAIDVEAPVFKDKKLREQAMAKVPFGYLTYVTDVERKVSHTVAADHDLYVSEAARIMKEFSGVCLNKFFEYSSK